MCVCVWFEREREIERERECARGVVVVLWCVLL